MDAVRYDRCRNQIRGIAPRNFMQQAIALGNRAHFIASCKDCFNVSRYTMSNVDTFSSLEVENSPPRPLFRNDNNSIVKLDLIYTSYWPSPKLVDFLPKLSMPFCALGAKRRETGKNIWTKNHSRIYEHSRVLALYLESIEPKSFGDRRLVVFCNGRKHVPCHVSFFEYIVCNMPFGCHACLFDLM